MAEVDLFEVSVGLPEGLRYRPELLTPDEETILVSMLKGLPFREFEFQGFLGKRRVVSFGWRYDFNGGGLRKTEAIPAFLLPLRERAAAFAELPASHLAHVLLTEYRPGAVRSSATSWASPWSRGRTCGCAAGPGGGGGARCSSWSRARSSFCAGPC